MALDSIYLGYQMPEHHRDAINNLFKSDSNIKIIKMEQVPGQLQVKPKDYGENRGQSPDKRRRGLIFQIDK